MRNHHKNGNQTIDSVAGRRKKFNQTVDVIAPSIQLVTGTVDCVIPDIQVNNKNIIVNPDDQLTKEQIFEKAVEEFESKCEAISNFCCQSCQMTGISIKTSYKNKQICTMCYASHQNKEDMKGNLTI